MNRFDKYKDYKRIIFYELPTQHARFLIQLHYDSLRQGEFFRALVDGYIEGDENIFKFIQNYKLENKKSKRQISVIKKEREKLNEMEKSFSLSENEKETIYDILAKEWGD